MPQLLAAYFISLFSFLRAFQIGDLKRTVQATGRKAWYFLVAKLAVVCLQVHATLPLAAMMVLPALVVSEWVSQFCKILALPALVGEQFLGRRYLKFDFADFCTIRTCPQ